MIPLRICLLQVGLVLTGLALLRLLRLREPSPILKLGLAVAAGCCSTMLVLYLPLALFGRVWFWPAVLLLAAGAVVELLSWLHAAGAFSLRRIPLAGLGIAAFVGILVLGANAVPYRGYDAKAIFGLKGKILLYERSLDGPAFQDVEVIHYHPDYPLGVPLMTALSGWVAEGAPADPDGSEPASSAEEWLARHGAVNAYTITAQLWLLGIACLILGAIRAMTRERLPTLLLLGICLPTVLVVPSILHDPWNAGWRSLSGGDRPLALCLGAAGLAYGRWLTRGERAQLVVAVLAAVGAIAVKNEGVVAVLMLLAAGVVLRARPTFRKGSAALLAGLLAGLALLAAVKARAAGAPYDEDFLGGVLSTNPIAWLSRVSALLEASLVTLEQHGARVFWLLFFLLAFPLAWRRGGASRLLATWVLLYVLASLGMVLVTPNHVVWQADTAIHRLLLQVTVPASILIAQAVAWSWSPALRRAGRPLPAD